jgi:hypothetical protein
MPGTQCFQVIRVLRVYRVLKLVESSARPTS